MTPLSNRASIARRRRLLPLRPGYSLAALFLLVATIAVLAGMASSLATVNNAAWDLAVPNLIIGLLGGALIGGTIGIHYERKIRATAIGALVGSTTGVAAGALSISDFSPYMALLQSGILVSLAVVVRLTTPGRPKPRFMPLPSEPPPVAPTPHFSHHRRGRLLAALLMGCCTLVSAAYLANSLRMENLSALRGWSRAGASAIALLVAAGLTVYLLWSAPSHELEPEKTRTSPWD